MKNSSHFPSDARMRHKSLFFLLYARGDQESSGMPSWVTTGSKNGINSSPLNKMADTFADDILKRILLNENVTISIKISLKFVSRGWNDNWSALVKVMAWHRTGDKPQYELMTTRFTDAYMRH